MGVIMPRDLKVVHIQQVFRYNCVRINEVPLLCFHHKEHKASYNYLSAP